MHGGGVWNEIAGICAKIAAVNDNCRAEKSYLREASFARMARVTTEGKARGAAGWISERVRAVDDTGHARNYAPLRTEKGEAGGSTSSFLDTLTDCIHKIPSKVCWW